MSSDVRIGWGGQHSSSFAKNDEVYLCITDFATGFSYEPKRKVWVPTNFRTNNMRFTLSKNIGILGVEGFR